MAKKPQKAAQVDINHYDVVLAPHITEKATLVSEHWVRIATHPRFADFRQRHPRVWTFVAARFALGEYLGLHLTIGLAVSIGALWLFGGVTDGAQRGRTSRSA